MGISSNSNWTLINGMKSTRARLETVRAGISTLDANGLYSEENLNLRCEIAQIEGALIALQDYVEKEI